MNVPPILPDGQPEIPVDPSEVPPIKPWRWCIHLLVIGSYPILIGLLSLGARDVEGAALGSDAIGLLKVCGLQMVIFGVFIGIGWAASRANRDDLLLRWRGGFWPIPLGIGYSVALRIAVGLVAAFVALALILFHVISMSTLQSFVTDNRPNVEAVVDVPAMRQNPVYYWLTLTVVSFIVAGFREELWRSGVLAGLRGLWPNVFSSRRGQFGAVGIAALIFGFGHAGQGILAVAMTAILGFGLGTIMILHRSIWPAVIAHGVFDATSLAAIPWVLEKLEEVKKATGH